jgi:uncharacterized membrane protein YqiK
VARGGEELERAARFEGELQAEFGRERASALGRAGRRLEEAIAEHREAVAAAGGELDPWVAELLLESIGERFHALVVQRECVGLIHDNVGWIRRHYDVPPGALYRR